MFASLPWLGRDPKKPTTGCCWCQCLRSRLKYVPMRDKMKKISKQCLIEIDGF